MAYYPSGCDADLQDHVCGSCGIETARVRSAAYINKSFYPTLIADPENSAVWAAGINSGEIIIIPETQGEYDGGAAQMGQGYGSVEEKINAYLFTADVMDPNYAGNRAFYNSIYKSRNFHFAFATESILFISDEPCTVIPSNPVVNDLKAEVVWKAQIKWTSENFPTEHDIPDSVFVCTA